MAHSQNIFTAPVGSLSTNCYIVKDSLTSKAVIIDPGDDAEYIEQIIRDQNCTPILILATHGHFDHIMAVTQLQLAYAIPFLIHAKDKFLVGSMQNSAFHFLKIKPDPPPLINGFLLPGSSLEIGESALDIIHTPGHTPGSVCFYSRINKHVFCGDLIFAGGGYGRVDFSYSDKSELKKSLKRVMNLPEDTIIYSGHGIHTTVGKEKVFYSEND